MAGEVLLQETPSSLPEILNGKAMGWETANLSSAPSLPLFTVLSPFHVSGQVCDSANLVSLAQCTCAHTHTHKHRHTHTHAHTHTLKHTHTQPPPTTPETRYITSCLWACETCRSFWSLPSARPGINLLLHAVLLEDVSVFLPYQECGEEKHAKVQVHCLSSLGRSCCLTKKHSYD